MPHETLAAANTLGCWEWHLASFQDDTLALAGGSDLLARRIAELRFHGVMYVACAARLIHPAFRLATETEAARVARQVEVLAPAFVVAIDAETTASADLLSFHVAAERVELIRLGDG
jgi:hypothetical protein